MSSRQQTTQSRSIFWGCATGLLACASLVIHQDLSAQTVDNNNVVNPAGQTNTIPVAAASANEDMAGTNYFESSTNVSQNNFPTAPEAYSVLPSASIGTGRVASPIYGTSALTGPPPTSVPVGLPALWQAGEVAIHAVLSENMLYGNGLQSSPGTQSSTFVSEFSPEVILDAGRNWVINYAPTIIDYSSDKFRDSVDQSEGVVGTESYEDWRFGLRQSYASGTQPLVETGQETSSEAFGAGLTASRELGSKLSIGMNAGFDYRSTENFNTVETWSGGASIYYSPMTQVSFNLSLSGGYDIITPGSDIVFESVQAGATFRPREKLTISFSGGAEDMQFVNPSAPSLISPVFNASASYQATKTTLVTINAQETVSPSFYANQVITDTSVAASLQQQLSKKLSFSISGAYSSEPYTSIEASALPQFYLGLPPRSTLETVRSDTTESFNVRLGYLVTRRLTASIFYTLSENSSGQVNFKYTSSQEGLSLSYFY